MEIILILTLTFLCFVYETVRAINPEQHLEGKFYGETRQYIQNIISALYWLYLIVLIFSPYWFYSILILALGLLKDNSKWGNEAKIQRLDSIFTIIVLFFLTLNILVDLYG